MGAGFYQRFGGLFGGIAVLCCLLAAPAMAAIDVYEFDDEVARQRYLAFIEELRCPKCQNQNLAGSDSPIAADLRRELRRLLDEGRSDKEIVDFMVSRYGDYVLYRPKVASNTLVLWGMPTLLLLLGLAVVGYTVRRRGRAVTEQAELDEQAQQRLATLLKEASEREKTQ